MKVLYVETKEVEKRTKDEFGTYIGLAFCLTKKDLDKLHDKISIKIPVFVNTTINTLRQNYNV